MATTTAKKADHAKAASALSGSPAKKAAPKPAAKAEPKEPTVELPEPPEGYRYVLMRGEHCLAQTCPMHLDDPLAYSKSPGFDVA